MTMANPRPSILGDAYLPLHRLCMGITLQLYTNGAVRGDVLTSKDSDEGMLTLLTARMASKPAPYVLLFTET